LLAVLDFDLPPIIPADPDAPQQGNAKEKARTTAGSGAGGPAPAVPAPSQAPAPAAAPAPSVKRERAGGSASTSQPRFTVDVDALDEGGAPAAKKIKTEIKQENAKKVPWRPKYVVDLTGDD
ncbi:hypothetical protein HDU93_002703, partial [Gonapodya sp. JEL0774]